VTRYEAHRKDAEARHKAGVVTRNELLQADVMLSDSKLRLVNAENALSVRESRVNSLLLRPLNDPVQPSEIVGAAPLPATVEECWAAAERDSPDLRDLDARIRAKEASVSSVRSEHLPTLYLSGGYEYSENQYQVHEDNWTVIAGVNLNLFAGGATSSRAGMAKAEALSLRISRERLRDDLRLEVKTAWLDIQSSRKKIDVAMAAVAQAEENLRLARLRYREGITTAAEVTDAVALMTTAETNAWRANFGLKRAEAALLYVTGSDLAAAYGAKEVPRAAPER
jgi:outer membrane protein TolC